MPQRPKRAAKRITIALPAFNEERHLEKALQPITKWRDSNPNRRNIKLLVVSDGSTDRTAEIARKAGVEVIHSNPNEPQKNMGKADAVREAARHARDAHKSDVLVTLDADTTRFSGDGIDALVKPVADGKYHMTVSDTTEGWQISRPESGSRGFYLPALNPWINGNPKWKNVRGFGLERGLNTLIPESKQLFLKTAYFGAEPPYRGEDSRGRRQAEEISSTELGLLDRNYPANRMRQLRSQGKIDEARKFMAEWHSERGEKYYKKKPEKPKP